MRRIFVALALASMTVLASACASPPLKLYTLEPSGLAPQPAPTSTRMKVVEVRRVIVPDFLDTQDITVRHGNTLARSSEGRWASRLSLAATYYLTGQLARRRPAVLVTEQPQVEPPDYRLFITISTLDVTNDGTGTLEADWLVVPRTGPASQRRRGRFTTTGPVATDQDVVQLNTALLQQLSDAVAASAPW